MGFRWMWYLIMGPSSYLYSGGSSAPSSEPQPVCHPGSIPGPMVRPKESTRRWRWHFAVWSPVTQRPGRNCCSWVEFAHNTLTSSSTGLSPFHCAYSDQPSLSPALEKEVSFPSFQAFISHCHKTWARPEPHSCVLTHQGPHLPGFSPGSWHPGLFDHVRSGDHQPNPLLGRQEPSLEGRGMCHSLEILVPWRHSVYPL